MSYSNNIRKLIDIQDTNITFEENCVQFRKNRGLMTKFIKAKLSYAPNHCSVCGVKNINYTIYKNGTKTSNNKLPTRGVYPTYLQLKKQRFFCKECENTFIPQTNIVERNCFISNHTKAKILVKSTDAQSLTDILKNSAVSPTTVQRRINNLRTTNAIDMETDGLNDIDLSY